MIKQKIPKALREQVWLSHVGAKYSGKCRTAWCENVMTVFDFQCGHDTPESKGGETIIENLIPICSRCNLSMSNTYTFKEWNRLSNPKKKPNRMIQWLQSFAFKASGIKSPLKNTSPNAKPTPLPGKSSKKE